MSIRPVTLDELRGMRDMLVWLSCGRSRSDRCYLVVSKYPDVPACPYYVLGWHVSLFSAYVARVRAYARDLRDCAFLGAAYGREFCPVRVEVWELV